MSTDHITVSTEKEKLVIPAADAVDSVFVTAAESPVKTFLTSSEKTIQLQPSFSAPDVAALH